MIPFLDLKAQYEGIKDEVNEAIQGVLENCQYVLGPAVTEFETAFAEYSGVSKGIGVNSGTSALHLALLAADVGPGDEVITIPMTFVATVAAIHYSGARTVFVDIDPVTYNMDPGLLEAAITPKTKAILPVHLHGQTADMGPILEIAKRHGLTVIEDAAQAHGAEWQGRRAGSMGAMGCFSFYPGKNLGAYGEAGMVVTDDPELERKLRMLRDWGAEKKYHHVLKGFNYRMEGIQGAVLGVKLKHLETWTEGRRAAAAAYDRFFEGSGVETPTQVPGNRHVYHVYAIRSPDREAWQQALNEQGIQSGIHYPIPVHLLPAYADLGYAEGDFPESERAAREFLSLPMFPEMTEDQCRTVADAVLKLAGRDLAAAS